MPKTIGHSDQARPTNGESYMKLKKSEVRIEPSNIGYIIEINDGMASPFLDVTQDELEEIVTQSLPYLRVPKGTKVVELKKK